MDTIFNKYSDNEQMRKESIISDNLSNIDNASKSYSNLQTQVDDVSKTIDSIKKASSNIGDDLKSSLQDLSASIKSIKSELESVKSNKISNIFDESSLINESQQIESFVKQLNDNISSTVKIKDIISTQVSESVDSQQIQQIFLELGNKINNIVSSGNGMNDVLNVIKQLKQSATEANSSLSSMNTAMSDQSINTSMSNNTNAMKEFNETSRKASDFASSFNKQQTQYSDELSKTTSNISKIAKEVVEASSGFDKVDSIAKKLFMSISSTNNMSVIDELTKAAEVGKAALNRNNDSQDIDDSNNKANALASSMTNIISLINEFSKNQIGNSSEISSDKYREIIGTTTNISENSGNALNKYTSMLEYESERTGNESHLNAANSLKMLTKEFVDATNNTLSNLNASLVSSINEETKILGNNFNNINQQGTNTYNDVNLGISSIHYKNIPNNLNSSSKEIESAMSAFGMQTEKINNGENPLLYSKISGNYLTNRSGFGQDLIDIQRKNTLGQMSIPGIMNKLKDAKSSGDQKLVVGLLEKLVVITESTAKAHLSAGGKIDLSKGQFNGLNENDKKTIDGFLSSAGSSSNSLSETIKAIEAVDPSNKSIDNLKKMRKELVDMKGEIETVKDKSGSIFSGAKGLISSIGKVTGVMGAGLGIMGLGALAPTISNGKKFVSNSFQSYEDDGKRRYQSAKNDFYTGNNLDVGKANELTNSMAEKYFKMSNGMIDFGEPTKYNTNLVRNVGGHYGESNASASKDMMSITRDTFALSKVYDLSDSTISSTMKTFYKDLRMSASDASYTLTSLCQTAISSNIPVEKYVNTVTSLANSLRDVGVDGRTTVSIMGNLVKSGMRTEDASQMLSDTANAGVKMGDNWSRSAFYGMMSGQSGDIWNNIESGMLSHDENSKPVDGYYQNMTDRLFTESGMMMGIGGGNNSLGISLLMQNLKQQGYSQKSASTIASLAKDGKLSEMKKMMMNEDSLNGPTALPDSTNEFNKSLAISASQLAETTKIQSDYKSSMNDMGILIDNNLSAPMKKMRVWIDKLMDKFVKLVDKIMKSMMSAYNTEIFQKISNFAVDNPIKTMIGIMGVAGIGKGLGSIALKKGFSYLTSSSSLISKVENKNINNIFSGFSKTKNMKILAALLAGGATLAVASKVFANSSNDSGNEVNKTLKNGSFKAQIINYEESKKWLLPIIGGSIGVLSVAKLLKLYNKKYGNKKLKMFSGKIKGGIMSSLLYATAFDLYDSYGENNSRSAANHMSNIISDTGGMFVGKKIGEGLGTIVKPGIGTKTGGIIGEIVGGAASDYFKKATGIAKEEDIVDQYKRDSNMIANEYKINVNETIDSNSEMSKIMKQSLVNHGVYVGDLNEDQKRFWLKLFNEYILMYNDINKAALAASRGLKHYSGKDHIFRNPNGSWSMDDAGKYEIYGKVSNDWDNDDITKAKWFEKRSDEQKSEADNIDDIYGKQAGKTEAYKYNLIANYYYHSNDATSEEYWQNLKNELHGEADRDDYEGQIMKSLYHDFVLNKLKKLDNSSSFNLNNASADDAKMFSKYLAEIYVEKEKSSYVETTGWEDVQDAIKNNNASGISGGQVDIFKDSGVTIDQLDQRLAGTNLEGTGSQIYRIAKQYGLDPRFFCAMLLHEGGSRNNPGNVENYSSGSRFGDFSSLEKGLEMSAKSWVGAAKAANSSDLAQACEIYAPSSDGNSDYATNTVQIMNEIDGPAVGYGNHAHNYGGKGTFRISENDHPDYDGMTDSTKSFMNALTSKFYDKTGVIVTMTSGYRPGDTGSRHAEGRAFDVVADEFEGEDGEKLRKIYGEIAAELGGTPLDEYESENAHYARGGGNFHVTAPESFNGATADGGYSPLQYQEQKPLSVKEQFNKGIKDYNNLVESLGGKSIQGNIVNGMYVDQNNEFKNIDTIKKEIEDQTKNSANNLFAQNDRVSYEQSTSNKNNEDMSNTISNAQNNGDENGILKNNHFNEIIKEVRDIALKYMDNPKIEMNCTLG